MCGFLLLAQLEPGAPLPHDARELDRLRDRLAHRGPDAGETWIAPDRSVALAHRRLSVLDLAGSRQPMASPDGRHHLVFNGEIYNFRELRQELEGLGWDFRTTGDTEVLLAAWCTWGTRALARLNGMFAFAVWDARERRVTLARDPLGIKPLCYGLFDGRLYAASDTSAVVADPRVPRRIDPHAVDLYFHHGYVPAPEAIWRGIRKLPAAHHVTFVLDGALVALPAPERYREIRFGRNAREPQDEGGLLDALDSTLRAAVERQTVSDVPLGAFLSGGIDSTLVVSYLAEISRHPVETFSVGYAEPRFDERGFARAVSHRYGTRHHELTLDPTSLEGLDDLARAYDEPFADPAALPTAAVSELARRHVTVALSGDGGDETHAGYPRYLDARRAAALDRVPLAWRRALLGSVARSMPSHKRRGFLEQASRDAADRYDAMTAEIPWSHRCATYGPRMRAALAAGELPDAERGASSWRRALQQQVSPVADPLDLFQGLDVLSALPERLLVKVDRASMRVSLEARVPLLDLDAVELATCIPAAWRVRDGRPKYLLRRLVERRAGREFAARKKHGFRVPEVEWLSRLPREPLACALRAPGLADWLDASAVERFLLDSPRGLEFAWPYLAFAAWHRVHAEPLAAR